MPTNTMSAEWHPGSFTKNAGWGRPQSGFRLLHEIIRVGFHGNLCDVPRRLFRKRVRAMGKPDYIPINFFLFNKVIDGKDHIIVDELVFNALFFDHSKQFDRLALLAFNLSYVGYWKGAKKYQSRPALWAHHYISDRIAQDFNWDTSKINADDIETFVSNDVRYKAKTARKLATNLNYYYKLGDLQAFSSGDVTRWWVDSLFLTLDRIIEHHGIFNHPTTSDKYSEYLALSNFHSISGRRSIEKDISVKHLLYLYQACGERERFKPEAVANLTNAKLPDMKYAPPNDLTPIAAIHPSNPKIIKTINKECAMLARYVANFSIISASELVDFNVDKFVKANFEKAMAKLEAQGALPGTNAQTLLKILRD